MKVPFVDLKAQYKSIKLEIDDIIQKVIVNTAFIKGKYVEDFEKQYSELYGVKKCIGVANGTDAIYIALKSLGIGKGDEVITTAHSWISTSETISLTGAKPIFIDTDQDFFSIDSTKIENAITSKTKAIIPVHLYGQPVDIERILDICKNNNLFLIEDCAQAHLAEFGSKKVGTFGDVGTFSFFPGKNLGAYGDAGGIITNNIELEKKMRMFANHGALVKHNHEIEGINSRLDGLQAAILSVKLKYLKEWTEKRINNANIYTKQLEELDNIQLPIIRKNSKHVFHLYVIRTEKRDELQNYLRDNGVSTGIHYPSSLPNLKAYDYLNIDRDCYEISNYNQSRILSLPMYPELSDSQISYICDLIKDFFT